MYRNDCHRWVEALENRRLLSASVDVLVTPRPLATGQVVTPLVATPNIVGSFTGTYVDSESGQGTCTFIFQTQSHTDHITGIVNSKAHGQHTQTISFTGKIKGDSLTFTAYFPNGDYTVWTSTVSKHGRVINGTYKSYGGHSSGSFSVSR